MSNDSPAIEQTKTSLENSVSWFLQDKLQDASIPIATKKYLTNENQLIYITKCNVADSTVPRVKVQVFERVHGGVHESGYQLFSDHRFLRYDNDMIFGNNPGTAAGDKTTEVSEKEAGEVLAMVNSLGSARQTL